MNDFYNGLRVLLRDFKITFKEQIRIFVFGVFLITSSFILATMLRLSLNDRVLSFFVNNFTQFSIADFLFYFVLNLSIQCGIAVSFYLLFYVFLFLPVKFCLNMCSKLEKIGLDRKEEAEKIILEKTLQNPAQSKKVKV